MVGVHKRERASVCSIIRTYEGGNSSIQQSERGWVESYKRGFGHKNQVRSLVAIPHFFLPFSLARKPGAKNARREENWRERLWVQAAGGAEKSTDNGSPGDSLSRGSAGDRRKQKGRMGTKWLPLAAVPILLFFKGRAATKLFFLDRGP